MEMWKEAFKGIIPTGDYQVNFINGEKQGLLIELENLSHKVSLYFGAVSASRMIDEGVLLNGYLYNDNELNKYKPDRFANVIYEIESGEFGTFIHEQYGQLYEILNLKHYLIITMNYCIDIVSQWEPEITVLNK
ncbi:MAG: hypothetical protein RR565_06630 [Erysipelothrix sp.]